ncbi:hypothetical protein KE530_01085 [Clostridiaceae bacterium Marseille-Q4145]|nr:hypothetical protein [Clostridiaceae bacterium Marseille-Q4145]
MQEERKEKMKNKQTFRQRLQRLTGMLLLTIPAMIACSVRAEAAEKQVEVQIPVRCEAETDSESFTYELSGESSEHAVVKADTLILKNGERGTFTITFDYPDTYHYVVSQRQGTEEKTIYDSTVCQLDVFVTEDADGVLHAEPVAYVKGSTEKKAELCFRNQKLPSDSHSDRKHPGKSGSDDMQNRSDVAGLMSPKTGDTEMPVFFMGLAVLAAAGILLIRHMQKKGGGEDAS